MLCVSRSRFASSAVRRVFSTTALRVSRRSLLQLSSGRSAALLPRYGSASFSTVPDSDAPPAVDADESLTSHEERGSPSDQRGMPIELRRELADKVVENVDEVLERVAAEHRNGYMIPDTFIRSLYSRLISAARASTNEELKERGVKTIDPAVALKNIEDIAARSKDWNVSEETHPASLISILLINGDNERAATVFSEAKGSDGSYQRNISVPFIIEFARTGDVEGFRAWLDKEYAATPEELKESEDLAKGEDVERPNASERVGRKPLRPRFEATRQFLWSLTQSGDLDKCDEFLKSLGEDSTWTVRLSPRSALMHWILRGNSKGIENGQKLAERHNLSKDVGSGQVDRMLRSWLVSKGNRNGQIPDALRMVRACQSQGIHVPLTEFVSFSRRALQDNAVPRFHFMLYRLEEHGMSKAAWRNMFNSLLRSVDENTVAHVPMLWRALQRRGGPNAATRTILTSKESRYRFLNNPDIPSSMLSFLGVPGNQDWTQQGAAPAANPNQWGQQPPAQQQGWGAPPQQGGWGAPQPQYVNPAADPWGAQQGQFDAQPAGGQWGQPQQPAQGQWGVPNPMTQQPPNQAGGYYGTQPQTPEQQQQQPNNYQTW